MGRDMFVGAASALVQKRTFRQCPLFPPKGDIDRRNLLPALGSPKVFETRWRQFRVSHRVLNIFVAEVGLQRPRIMPPVRECVTARMAQHVRMHTELKPSLLARPCDHLREEIGRAHV